MINSVWLSWNNSRRSKSISSILGIPFVFFPFDGHFLYRHGMNALWTIFYVLKKKPKCIFIQYSFLLLVIMATYKLFSRKVILICDCHTKALRRNINGFPRIFFQCLKRWSFKKANLAIVSNKYMLPDIKIFTNKFIILQDPLPKFLISPAPSAGYVVFSCSFAVDEPVEEILQATRLLKDRAVYITGKKPHYIKASSLPGNLKLTGYLNDDDYIELISRADCIIALTTEPDCLQCSGYEALALGVPLVLSNSEVLQETFCKAAVYIENNSQSIAEGINKIIMNREQIKNQINIVYNRHNKDFQQQLNKLLFSVNSFFKNE